ncbi:MULTISPECIES: YfhE family protein [unclassified Bacillus (in: firmicutes)]|nr:MULTISPECIES: YfhE family protein [unclassified Bacillus (in: firmicutes)]SFQ86489.1 YfhE-like protein [Bacillus sp. cl95]
MEKKKKEKTKSTLSSMQEVLYAHEFRKADRAAGFGTSGKRGGNI